MKKIVTVIGARPQFVKAAIVSRALSETGNITELLVHTGQHYDDNMSRIFFEELSIPTPHFHLGIGSGPHGQQTGDMLRAIESLLIQEKPDGVLVYGDTNSTLAGALAAIKLHLPLAHVEAGLRSWNRRMPEEINRMVTDQLADTLFAPTEQAVHNLRQEGYADSRIILSGDVMYDAALFYAAKAQQKSGILSALQYEPKGYILATLHRAENTDDPARLRTIFRGLERMSETLPVVMPLHPRTRHLLSQHWPEQAMKTAIRLIEPVGFLDMIMLEKQAALIMTDSGGVQKEAFFYEVPCVTLRDETEWVETVDLGWNTLVKPTDPDTIHALALGALGKCGQPHHYPFGKGNASALIARHFVQGN